LSAGQIVCMSIAQRDFSTSSDVAEQPLAAFPFSTLHLSLRPHGLNWGPPLQDGI
jgi:hypothetical protein